MASRIATLIVAVIVTATIAAGLIVGAQRDDHSGPVDVIVYNGRVYQGAGKPLAEAVAIRGHEILRVGANAEIKPLGGRATQVIDAHGGAVLPGFIDAHLHFISGGLGIDRIDLLDAETLDAIKRKIRGYAAANPDRPWVLGQGWYYSPFPGGLPTRQQLDELVPDRPAYIRCYDGHTGWANTKALQLAGITRETPDPPDGILVKDPATGEPTGILKEAAQSLMSKVMPKAISIRSEPSPRSASCSGGSARGQWPAFSCLSSVLSRSPAASAAGSTPVLKSRDYGRSPRSPPRDPPFHRPAPELRPRDRRLATRDPLPGRATP